MDISFRSSSLGMPIVNRTASCVLVCESLSLNAVPDAVFSRVYFKNQTPFSDEQLIFNICAFLLSLGVLHLSGPRGDHRIVV